MAALVQEQERCFSIGSAAARRRFGFFFVETECRFQKKIQSGVEPPHSILKNTSLAPALGRTVAESVLGDVADHLAATCTSALVLTKFTFLWQMLQEVEVRRPYLFRR